MSSQENNADKGASVESSKDEMLSDIEFWSAVDQTQRETADALGEMKFDIRGALSRMVDAYWVGREQSTHASDLEDTRTILQTASRHGKLSRDFMADLIGSMIPGVLGVVGLL